MNAENLLTGVIAVDLGLVDQASLDACLREQEAKLDARPIGEVLLAKGMIDRLQLDALLAEQQRRANELGEAGLFGQVAMSKGLITPQQLGECVREQIRAGTTTGHGAPKSRPHLGALMMTKGYLSRAQFREIIAAQGKVLFHCARCKGYFTHPAGTSVAQAKCPRCMVMLAVVGEGEGGAGSSSADGTHDTTQFIKAPLASLGKFEILGEIARGSMGIVFKAHDSSLDRTVALKVLKEGDSNVNFIRRLHREAALAAKLRHEHIVTVHEVGEIEGLHYLCMDFIEGVELVDFIRRRRLPPKQWLRLFGKIARAVHYAHTQGVIHRDLKPSNILVTEKGEPFIMDFGLAKQLDDAAWLTKEGTAMGTPYYMPPEQVLGKLDRIDQRSDVYSLGVILYEIITGGTPFIGETALEIYQKVLTQEPIWPGALVPNLDPDLEAICLKAMEKEPDHRYSTAEDLAFDIGRHLVSEPIMARRATPMRAFGRRLRKHAWRAGVLAAAVIATVAIVVGTSRVGRARQVADLEREAQGHYEAKRWEEARASYRAIVAVAPGHSGAYERIGELNVRIEQEKQAVAKTAVREFTEERGKREAAAKPFFTSGTTKMDDARSLMHQKPFDPERVNAKLGEAVDEFTKAIERDPDYADAYYLRGRCYVETGRPHDAEQDFSKAVAISPQNPGALLERGKIYFVNAVRGLKGGLRGDGGTIELSFNPIDADSAEWKKRAFADFAAATDAASQDERFLMAAFMCLAEGDYAMAVTNFSRTLSRNPVNADAVFGRGFSHLLRAEYELAIEYFERALELKPNMYAGYSMLGLAYTAQGDTERAIPLFRRVVALGDATAMENLASVYALLGRWDEALEVFDMILRRGTRDRKVELARASVLYAKGEFQRTLEAAQKIIDAHPQWSEPYELSAVCYAKLGSPERAREYLKRAVELDAKNTGALANYAYMLYEEGRLDEAYDMASRALEREPDVHALLVRGAVLAKRGQLGDALADFTAATRAAPRDVRTHQHRALALLEMGRYDEAIEAAELVKRIDPRETARADRLIQQATERRKGREH